MRRKSIKSGVVNIARGVNCVTSRKLRRIANRHKVNVVDYDKIDRDRKSRGK